MAKSRKTGEDLTFKMGDSQIETEIKNYSKAIRDKVPYDEPSKASAMIAKEGKGIIKAVGYEGFEKIAKLCLKYPQDDIACDIIESGSELISLVGNDGLENLVKNKGSNFMIGDYAAMGRVLKSIGAKKETIETAYQIVGYLGELPDANLVVNAARTLKANTLAGYELFLGLQKLMTENKIGPQTGRELMQYFPEAAAGKSADAKKRLLNYLGAAKEAGMLEVAITNLDKKAFKRGYEEGHKAGKEQGRSDGYSEGYSNGYEKADANAPCNCGRTKVNGSCPVCDDMTR